MKTYRFFTEYANYIKSLYRAADMPKDTKAGYINQIDAIIKYMHRGLITLNEGMKDLNQCEKWILDYNLYGNE